MKTTVFWSCTGMDGSELTWQTAELLAERETTLVIELPCLGIPRLGFVCGISDKLRNTEAAICYYEQHGKIPLDMIHPVGKRLHVLPACVFAVPDYPVVAKVDVHTLMTFIAELVCVAKARGYDSLVLDCQGQLHSVMTFFALREAGQIVIPLGKPSEAAYALSSVRRLVRVYRHRADKFILACKGNLKTVEHAAFTKTGDYEALAGLRVTSWDRRRIKSLLLQGSSLWNIAPDAVPDAEQSLSKEDEAVSRRTESVLRPPTAGYPGLVAAEASVNL